MDWLIFIIGMVVGVLLFEVAKHFFFKRTGRLVLFLVIVFILFIIFSAVFAKNDFFKENKFVQTGAAIANVFSKNTEGVRQEGLDKGSGLFNSTFKRE
ncbi:MAG: hypothetical protein ABIH63_02710 [archaeon]